MDGDGRRNAAASNEEGSRDVSTNLSPRWRKAETKTYSRRQPTVQPPDVKTTKERFADIHHEWLMDKIMKKPVDAVDVHRRSVHDVTNTTVNEADIFNSFSNVKERCTESDFPIWRPRKKPIAKPRRPPPLPATTSDDETGLVHYGDCPDMERFIDAKLIPVFVKPRKWWNSPRVRVGNWNRPADMESETQPTDVVSASSAEDISVPLLRRVSFVGNDESHEQQNSIPVDSVSQPPAIPRSRFLASQSAILPVESASRNVSFVGTREPHEKQTSTPVDSPSLPPDIRRSRFDASQSTILSTKSATGSSALRQLSGRVSFTGNSRKAERWPQVGISDRRASSSWRTVLLARPRESMLPRFSCEVVDESASLNASRLSFMASADSTVIRQKFLEICGQSSPGKFTTFFPESVLSTCVKIGEGTFGEVFAVNNDERLEAVKMICIEGNTKFNGMSQLTYRDLLIEVTVAQNLSDLRDGTENRCSTFMEVYGVQCAQGRFPEQMIQKWEESNKNKPSLNDNPKIFPDDQLFVTLIGEHCGTCLEEFKDLLPNQAWSVLWQLSLALAVAEMAVEFEHRDLHCGNVMVKHTDDETIEFVLNNISLPIPSYGIRAVIIDYSLSRIAVDDHVVYVNLSLNRELFTGNGEQYQVYRDMRKANGNDWKKFNAVTNVQWLMFVGRSLDKLAPIGKRRDDFYRQRLYSRMLRTCIAEIRRSSSAMDFVSSFYATAMIADEATA